MQAWNILKIHYPYVIVVDMATHSFLIEYVLSSKNIHIRMYERGSMRKSRIRKIALNFYWILVNPLHIFDV